jgi:acyl carrier protein
MQIDERLKSIFRTVFSDSSLDIEANHSADNIKKWDSLNHISLIFEIENEYQITFSTTDLETMEDVGDLQKCINRKLSS